MTEELVDDLGNEPSDRISRRRMLQRIGVGAAVVWSAPVISSFGSPAFAGTSQACNGPDWVCGQTLNLCGSSGPFQRCLCDVDVEGKPFCWEDYACPGGGACTTSADCTGGFRCVTNCCTGTTCAPPCGYSKQRKGQAPKGGQTASGG